MNSKVHQTVAAVLALGAAAGAHAIDISGAGVNVLTISGSTAIDPGLSARWTNTVDNFCAAGTIDTYSGTQAGVKFTAVACTGGAGAPTAAQGQPIAYIKEDNVGSLNGITPVNNATTVAFPNVSLMTTANCGATSPHTCGAAVTAQNLAPNFGFSDVEAALFGANAANLQQFNSIDTVFAPAVSLGLYHALQSVQGISTANQDDSVTHMPTLTRGQVYGIFQGVLTPASLTNAAGTANVGNSSVAFGTSSGASACGTNATCTTTDTAHLYICQRGQSSGSEQTTQVFFGNIGCAAGVSKFAPPGKPGVSCAADGCGWSTTFLTVTNFAGNGTGDVLSCLQAHDAAGHLAVGLASIDNGWGVYQGNTARKDFRYVRLGGPAAAGTTPQGIVPSLENVSSDLWQYWAQSSAYAPLTSASNYPTTTIGQALEVSFEQIGTVGTVSALNSAFHYTAPQFDGGFLAIPGVAGAAPNTPGSTQAQFLANPVNNFVRNLPSNNCQPAVQVSSTPTADFATWQTP